MSLLSKVNWLKAFKTSKAEEQPFVCAMIPAAVLSHVEQASGMSEEVRQSMRATLWASDEAHKEREDVGDKDKDPHEPKLPSPDSSKTRGSEIQDRKYGTRDECATVNIHDGLNSDYTRLPGALLRRYGQEPVADNAANECYEAMNHAQTFFRDVYGWDSLDDKNMPMVATVHQGYNMANAFFYSKYKQMVFGNGNKVMYGFHRSLDVIGHELTHGIIQFSSGMIYSNQSGALNEHCADVFGALLEQYSLKQTADKADWLLAQDVLFPDQPTIALRSMKAPGTAYNDPKVGKDNQPAHMKDYVMTDKDYGGVHTNSGIPNRAFYLAATRKGGYAWETVGKAWFAAMTTATPREGFVTFANRTVTEAKKLLDDPDLPPIIEQAWKDVGVLSSSSGLFDWMWGRRA